MFKLATTIGGLLTWTSAILALALMGCSDGTTRASKDGDVLTVSLAAFNGTFVNFPIYVADALGLFRKHGLDVRIIYGTGTQVANAVVSGSANFGGFSIEHVVQLADKGQDLKILVLNQAATPFTLVVRNEVPLPNAANGFPAVMRDVKGLKLAISSRGSGADIALRFLLKQAGMDPEKDVSIIPIGDPGPQIAALRNGQVDGSMAFEPIQTAAVHVIRCCKAVVDLQGGQGPSVLATYPYNGIVVRRDYLERQPEAARRMVLAIVDAERIINDENNIDTIVAIASRTMRGINADALKDYLKAHFNIFQPVMTEQGFANVNQVLLETGLIKNAVPYEAVTATEFMPRRFEP